MVGSLAELDWERSTIAMAMFRIRATSFVAGFAAASAIALYQLHTGVWSSHQELGNKVIFPNFWSEVSQFYHASIRSPAPIACLWRFQTPILESSYRIPCCWCRLDSIWLFLTLLGYHQRTGVFCLISYGSLVSKLRSYYAFYTKICLSLPISSGGVAETHQYKDPLSGTDNEVSGEREMLWMVHGQMARHHLAIAACVICFLFILLSDCFFWWFSIEHVSLKALALIIWLDFFLYLWVLFAHSYLQMFNRLSMLKDVDHP
jgi:hypothetical protein